MTTEMSPDLLDALASLEVIEGADVAKETPVAAPASELIDITDDVDDLLAELEGTSPVVAKEESSELDDLLLDLEVAPAASDAKEESIQEENATDEVADEPVSEETLEIVDKELMLEEAKEEVYSAAESGGLDDKAHVEPEAPKMKSRASGASKPSDALVQRLGNVDAVYKNLVFSADDAAKTEEELRKECEARLKEFDVLPKKVGEKAVNLVAHIAGNAKLSTYTEIAIQMLLRDGQITQSGLFERYRKRPYSEGTSRSQAGQIMRLFQTFKIADGTTSALTLNKNSIIAQVLEEVVGKAA